MALGALGPFLGGCRFRASLQSYVDAWLQSLGEECFIGFVFETISPIQFRLALNSESS